MSLAAVKIILVEPQGPLNVGSVARVMKNMGLQQLVLVNPQCDRLNAEARQMAVHAADLLEAAQEVATLPEALQGCQRAIATTGRSDTTLAIPLEHPRIALPWLLESESLESGSSKTSSALIFGREDRGLTNEELNYAQRLVFIPAHADYLSLNLAQAVAICCYELQVAAANFPLSPHLPPSPFPPPDLASLDAIEAFYQQLEQLLLEIGYLFPHTADSRMEKFRRLLNRAYPSATEVAMLRGILRQVTWALTQKQNG